jgi:hypothetical protein
MLDPRRHSLWAQGFVALLICCVTLASPVFAGLTSISAPPSREKDQAQILSHTYGGTFVADGNDFTNGAIRAVRLDDGGGDSFFNSGIYSANTLAQFAQRQQGFGYVDGTAGGTYHKLFEASGSGFDASGSASDIDITSTFRAAMNGVSAIYTSNPTDNPKQADAAITYRIEGVGNDLARYALFWENLNADEPAGKHTVNDYNDLVVELRETSGVASAIPLPRAVWGGIAVLLGVLFLNRRKAMRAGPIPITNRSRR